jgi:polyisoprenoid-binding protein YceI
MRKQRVRLPFLLLFAIFCAPIVLAQDEGAAPSPPGTLEFVGKNLLATADGRFHDWRIVDSHLDLERPESSFAVVEVQLASVDTGIRRRDDHLRNPDFFEVDTYPVATARVHSPRPLAAAEDGRERFAVRIDLDLHGVQKTLDGEVTLASRDPLAFEGELTIDRTQFGVGSKPSRWNPMAPRAEIPVRFRVEP